MAKRKQRVMLVRTNYLTNHMGLHIVPPLGVLTLAAVLRKERPKDVEFMVMDTGAIKATPDKVAAIIREYEPDVLGLGALSLESGVLHTIAHYAKEINPEIKVIAGGPHATTFYDHVLQDPNVDYAVVGEGEETLVELLDRIRDGADASDVPGVASRVDGRVHFAGPRPFIDDLDSLPFPAFDLIDLKPYTRAVSMNGFIKGHPYANIFTSRACPYRCNYCHSNFGKKYRAQSAGRVVEEVEWLSKKIGVRELHVIDDLFNFDRKRVMAISEGVRRRGIDMKFAFPNAVRGDLMNRELIRAMIDMGAYAIGYSVETASPRLQKLVGKNLDVEKVRQVVEWTYEEGAIPGGGFMLGFPTETREEMESTIRFAARSRFVWAYFFCVTPFPRTGLWDMVREMYPHIDLGYESTPVMHFWSDKQYYTEASGIDMKKIRLQALKTFYGTPWRMAHILRKFPLNFWRTVVYSLMYWTFGWKRGEDKNEYIPDFPPWGLDSPGEDVPVQGTGA